MGKTYSIPSGEALMKRFHLSRQQYDDLKLIFEEHSKGKRGLSKNQFRKVYSARFPGNVSKYADRMFDCFDTDGNGHVDFEEFAVGVCMLDSNNIEDRIQMAFRIFDKDKNGFIDRQEVQDLLWAYNQLYGSNTINSRKIAEELFDTMDTNKDNHISEEEFKEGVHKIPDLLNLIRPEPGY